MNSLIGIFKKSQKGDAFRPVDNPDQYNDGIARLNSLGANQYEKINTQTINRTNRDRSALTQNNQSVNSILPGSNS